MFPKFSKLARTPTVLQMEAVECGAACLGIILSYYKVYVPLAELRAACGVSRDGSKASNIVKAARLYGLNAKGFRKELDQVKELKAPFVVFWNFRHFVVVEGFKGDQVFLNDPACGPRRVSIEEFGESFTGVVLIMEPGPDFKRYGQPRSLARALWQRLKKFPSAAVFSLLLAVCLVIPGLLIPMFTKVFVDQYILAQLEQWLRPLLFVMLLTFIVQWLLEMSRMRVLRRLATGLSASESARFVWHILHLPVSFYDQRFSGEITNRISLNDRVADLIAGDLAIAFLDLLMVTLYSVVLFFFDPLLCGIGVGLSAVTLLSLRVVSRKRVDAQRRMTTEVGRAQGIALAGFQSIETLKASGHEGSFFERWAGHYAGSVNAQLKLGMSAMILSVLPTAMQGLTTAIILGVGALRVMDGEMSVGDLMAFQLLMTQLQLPVTRFVDLGSRLQELEADLDRIDDVFQAQPDGTSKSEPDYPDWDETKIRLSGRVELKDVSFGYSRVDRPLLKNFNLVVEPGQRVALVGGSGSGKSTAAKLITGLYEPWSGEILFDDTPVAKIPRQVLANSIASVAQSIFLFAGTVRDNLTLWDETVREERLEEACRDAAIDEVVSNLPGGFNGELIEAGSNLSGGQRQRLEIARALIPRPSVLILDEATSALDTEIEQVIDKNLRRRGCSTILVSHRLSTVRDCDEIIVLKRGKIVQRGTHEELWKKQKGEYAQLLMSEGEDRPS